MFSLACVQLGPRIGDLEHNARVAAEGIARAASAGADLVVLPELASSGYMFASADEARALAQPADGAAVSGWVEAAREHSVIVVAGFAELGNDGLVYNSAAVVDGSGVLTVYRKTHLWDREKLVFTPGDTPPPVVATPLGRLGVTICYDLEFHENVRGLAIRGADVILAPTNWPLFPRPTGERPPEVINCMALARFNRVFVAACDRVGSERGQDWTGGSVVIDEQGWPITEAPHHEPALLLADIDVSKARDKRWTDHADLMGDRRPGLYGALTGEAERPTQQGGHDDIR